MYIDKNIYKIAKNPEMYVDMPKFLIWIYKIIDNSYENKLKPEAFSGGMYVCIFIFIYVFVDVYFRIYVNVSINVYACMYIHLYICIVRKF
jgi:hypothetical protein